MSAMLIIRLQRVGRKNDPSFRVIVTDSHRAAKTGKVLEVLGAYDARSTAGQKREIKLNTERVKYWLTTGAQVSDTVHNLLVDAGLRTGPKINVLPKNKNKKPAEPVTEPVAEPVAEAVSPQL